MKRIPIQIVLAVLLLSGCAYVNGPCSLSASTTSKSAFCEAGGTMMVIPGSVLQDLQRGPNAANLLPHSPIGK